ncbi:sorting nexin-25 isoform X2 [Labeo rohita]|uniref:Sorting nexin-25 isoform X2 n=1 Tax=Labeo rohita TaxID=84645 RepID=A0A498P663_LABRO|nr:sorting nexin-25 isoform X2 [Labeo rohita]
MERAVRWTLIAHISRLILSSVNATDSKGKEAAALKADLLRARNMKRYINQLTVAKKQCEKRIRLLGGPNYEQQEDGGQDEGDGPQSQRLQAILSYTDRPVSVRP